MGVTKRTIWSCHFPQIKLTPYSSWAKSGGNWEQIWPFVSTGRFFSTGQILLIYPHAGRGSNVLFSLQEIHGHREQSSAVQ